MIDVTSLYLAIVATIIFIMIDWICKKMFFMVCNLLSIVLFYLIIVIWLDSSHAQARTQVGRCYVGHYDTALIPRSDGLNTLDHRHARVQSRSQG